MRLLLSDMTAQHPVTISAVIIILPGLTSMCLPFKAQISRGASSRSKERTFLVFVEESCEFCLLQFREGAYEIMLVRA